MNTHRIGYSNNDMIVAMLVAALLTFAGTKVYSFQLQHDQQPRENATILEKPANATPSIIGSESK